MIRTLATRLATLEAERAQAELRRLESMPEDEVMAELEATYGPEALAWLVAYLDALPMAELEAIADSSVNQPAPGVLALP
jgi:hypothetical protein